MHNEVTKIQKGDIGIFCGFDCSNCMFDSAHYRKRRYSAGGCGEGSRRFRYASR